MRCLAVCYSITHTTLYISRRLSVTIQIETDNVCEIENFDMRPLQTVVRYCDHYLTP